VVPDGILEDALEQQRQLFGRATGVVLGEAQHGVLDQIKCEVFVTRREHRVLVCAALELGQEGGKLFLGSQCCGLAGW
jgi:hypothetical protein